MQPCPSRAGTPVPLPLLNTVLGCAAQSVMALGSIGPFRNKHLCVTRVCLSPWVRLGYNDSDVAMHLNATRATADHPNVALDLRIARGAEYRCALGQAWGIAGDRAAACGGAAWCVAQSTGAGGCWICICLDTSAGPEPSCRAHQISRSGVCGSRSQQGWARGITGCRRGAPVRWARGVLRVKRRTYACTWWCGGAGKRWRRPWACSATAPASPPSRPLPRSTLPPSRPRRRCRR